MVGSAIAYKILYHERGYLRLEVPSIRKLSWSFLFKNFKKSPPFPIPTGIKDLHVNPFKGNVVIIYEPEVIDIIEYLKSMASDPDVKKIIGGERK